MTSGARTRSLTVAVLSALTLLLAALAGASPTVEGTDDSRLGAELPRAPRKDGTFRNLDPDFRRASRNRT